MSHEKNGVLSMYYLRCTIDVLSIGQENKIRPLHCNIQFVSRKDYLIIRT